MNITMNHLYASYQQNIANGDGNRFAARPQKQWRKQYQNQNNLTGGTYRRAGVGMPMDRPGGLVPVASPKIQCQTCNNTIPANVEIIKDSPCTSCQPIINNVRLSDKTFTNNTAYLQSRCSIYEQKSGIVPDPAVDYFSAEGIPLEPSSSHLGPQRRESLGCFTPVCQPTIYKPSNTPHAQQGGVSSSSRIARLKYNTLNNYPVNTDGSIYSGSVFNTGAGALGVNSGRYQIEASPSYFTKYKPQAVAFLRKSGTKIYCNSANTICISE
jgi:hypothetical protein